MIFFSFNILLSIKTNIDFVNNTSTYLTESDESSFHKEKIVDFIADNTKIKQNEVTIFFDLEGGFFNWTKDFNKNFLIEILRFYLHSWTRI